MNDQLAEKFAALFAKCAATGDTTELRKEAAAHSLVKEAVNPLLTAAVAAAIGGGAGYVTADKKKNKLRNALYGALTGGLGGAGGALAWNAINGPIVAPVSTDPGIHQDENGKLVADRIHYDMSSNNPDSPMSKARLKADAVGGLAGATFTGRLLDRYPRLFGGPQGYGGELDRLGRMRVDATGKKNPYTAVRQLLENARAGRPFAQPPDAPTPIPAPPPVSPFFPPPAAPTAPDRKTFANSPIGDIEFDTATKAYEKAVAAHNNSAEMAAYDAAAAKHEAAVARRNDAAATVAEQNRAADAAHQAARAAHAADVNAINEAARTGSVGDGPDRDRVRQIIERNSGGGTIQAADLNRAKGWRPFHQPWRGRFQVGRAAGRVGGGIFGSLATETVLRLLQNAVANASDYSGAPTSSGYKDPTQNK